MASDGLHPADRRLVVSGASTGILLATAIPLIGFAWDWEISWIPSLSLSRVAVFQAFIIWILAFVPSWLFVRFLISRGPALWDEYVVNLHRLGVDDCAFLPKPPEECEYYRTWKKRRQSLEAGDEPGRNLYEEKFNAYYGRDLAEVLYSPEPSKTTLPNETLFPVILTGAIFAAGWSAIFIALDSGLAPVDKLERSEVTAFTFAGAYLFTFQTLIRRYFQRDLRASAYTSAIARTISAIIIARVAYEVFPTTNTSVYRSAGVGAAAAFAIGMFPLAGVQALRRASSRVVGLVVPSLRSTCPLSDIQGMTVWYEARLIEEGIEDSQDLATANLVDVILHTRVPAPRLVDWLDQAHLLLYLEPKKRAWPRQPPTYQRTLREALESWGIRRATTFLVAFGVYCPVEVAGASNRRDAHHTGNHDRAHAIAPTLVPHGNSSYAAPVDPRGLADKLTEKVPGWDADKLLMLVRILANNTALTPVLNWYQWGAERLYELETGSAAKPGARRGVFASLRSR